ncbi:tetratricopeptide repeat protein, partial [Desulfobulbus sp. F3]|nr:tetratricopeptide repeat protein [Desulfobulbus sp. F3]
MAAAYLRCGKQCGECRIQEGLLHYDRAAEYYQKAAALLPECRKKDRARYLNKAAINFLYASRDADALPLFEQSLKLCREIEDKENEVVTRWNIGITYEDLGDLAKAEEHISLAVQIAEQIGH